MALGKVHTLEGRTHMANRRSARLWAGRTLLREGAYKREGVHTSEKRLRTVKRTHALV